MNTISGKTFQDVYVQAMRKLYDEGVPVTVRGMPTKELHPVLIQITEPWRRTLLMPKRGNDPFATLAETCWVLAGRSDMQFLKNFLPRCVDYSDSGVDWRAGYGKRLMSATGIDNWGSATCVDQLSWVLELLKKDPETRQAIMTIWDPVKECTVTSSKDIPCTSWLHFMVRDAKLDLEVVMRSNDVVFGTCINIYEFTVLQELVADILKIPMGNYYHYVSSLHYYTDKHENKLKELIEMKQVSATDMCLEPFCFRASEINLWGISTIFNRLCADVEVLVECIKSGDSDKYTKFQQIIDTLAFRGKAYNDILRLLAIYLFINKVKDNKFIQNDVVIQDIVKKIYTGLMVKIPMTDLKVSCHFWVKKNYSHASANDLQVPYEECLHNDYRKL